MKPPFISTGSVFLAQLFEVHKNSPALKTRDGISTFGDVYDRLQNVTASLKKAGVQPGNRVALHMENSELHLYLFLASWIMNFLFIPLDFKAPLQALPDIAEMDFLLTPGDVPTSLPMPIIPTEGLMAGHAAAAGRRSRHAVPFRREASAVFTSGSTGRPRAVVHTVGNYIYSALGTNAFIGLETSDRWLLSLPLFHVGGILIWVRTLLAGCMCIIPDNLKNLELSIRNHRPTVLSLVPTQLIRLLHSEPTVDILRSAKTILLGGAPAPPWLIEKALDRGIPIMPTYGSTESCAQVTAVVKGAAKAAYLTAGSALPYREIRTAGDGTILLGGKTIFKRYLHDHKTGVSRKGGFFRTADAGCFDSDGNLVVLGRKDGMFISGGENIHPFEIENRLLNAGNIAVAIVVPVFHSEYGAVPWAFVECEGIFDEAEILTALKNRLPAYKVPKRIIRLEPEQGRGGLKYSRKALAEMAGEMAAKERYRR